LAAELEKQRPGFRALFMSGYPSDVIDEQGVLEEQLEFLQKPFGVGEFMQRVREVLDKPSE